VRLCFLISAHDRGETFRIALDAVYDPRHLYLVHIDSKSTDALCLAEDGRIHRLPRMSVTWGGFSAVEVELAGIRKALELGEWDYLIYMSGTDLLVRPLAELERFLANAGSASFIQRRPFAAEPHMVKRLEKRNRWFRFELGGRRFRLPIPLRLFGKVATHYGSQWHFLHRSFCSRVIQAHIPVTLRHCHIPDEFFWQNILGGEGIEPVNWRYAVFHGKPNPKWLTEDDIDDIEASGAFLARKFDSKISASAIEHFAKVRERG
jgi:hypothetical protein